MKLTKQNLVNIIKEEIEAVVNEQMSDQMDPDLMNKILEILGQDGFVRVEEVQKQLSMERDRGGQDLDPDDDEVAEHIEELVEDGILSGPDAAGDYEEGDNFVNGKAYEVY